MSDHAGQFVFARPHDRKGHIAGTGDLSLREIHALVAAKAAPSENAGG